MEQCTRVQKHSRRLPYSVPWSNSEKEGQEDYTLHLQKYAADVV